MTNLRARIPAFIGCLVAVAVGLACRYGLSGMPAKYLGVALWSTTVYAILMSIRPAAGVHRAALVALGISWAVEFAQLTPVPAWLSSQHVLLRLLFGTTFSVADLPAYAAGVALGAALSITARRRADRVASTSR